MSKFIVYMLLMLFFLPTQAEDTQEINIQAQQSDQELCAQQFYNQCINKCEKIDDIDCQKACEENAKNQCLQAGE